MELFVYLFKTHNHFKSNIDEINREVIKVNAVKCIVNPYMM